LRTTLLDRLIRIQDTMKKNKISISHKYFELTHNDIWVSGSTHIDSLTRIARILKIENFNIYFSEAVFRIDQKCIFIDFIDETWATRRHFNLYRIIFYRMLKLNNKLLDELELKVEEIILKSI
jgi:hypothetical protein